MSTPDGSSENNGFNSAAAGADETTTESSKNTGGENNTASGQSRKYGRGQRRAQAAKTASSDAEQSPGENAAAKKRRAPRRKTGRQDAAASGQQAPAAQTGLEGQQPDVTDNAEAANGEAMDNDSRDTAAKPQSKAQARKKRTTRLPRSKASEQPVAGAESVTTSPITFTAPLETARAISLLPALPPANAPESSAPEAKTQRQEGERKKKGREKKPQAARQTLKRMFISVLPGEQVEVALAEDGTVLEYYLDMLHQRKIKGNIYKGIVHNIDTNLQAAFVDYGGEKNGFLQIDEVHPEYWQAPHDSGERKFPPIQKVLKTGQEILVQVVKEPAGSKGAFLTTWLSLAGRFLVLTPGQEQIGVSRKVTDHEERVRLRELMNGIEPGNGLGVIVRTVGEGATKTTLKTDLQYLKRLWRDIRKKATEVRAPSLIHQEPGLSERAVRDYLTEDVREIWVDNDAEAKNVSAIVNLLFPRKKELVKLYSDVGQTIWEHFNLEKQLDQIYAREVILPSGGRLVFDQTEALMAIDINSGKISGKGNFEAMAFKTNMEASEAIARQLRLRDIGGQVVIDFIEMRDKKHVLEVEKTLRQAMKSDRAKHDVARMSSFGLLELVRQRMGSSALSITMETCTACGGTGLRRNIEWQALQALRDLRHRLKSCPGPKYVYDSPRELGMYLLNYKRETLQAIEKDFGKTLEIRIQI